MKKRNLSNLTEEDLKGILSWTRNSNAFKKVSCPFHAQCQKCLDLFPGLGWHQPEINLCPCQQCSISYVTKVAKQILLEKNFIPK